MFAITILKVERDFDVEAKVINITVDINNIPDSKRNSNSKETFIGNPFTAFRNHQNPRRFQTAPKKFQSHISTSQNYKTGHSKYKTNQAPTEEGVSESWQRVAQKFSSKLESGAREDGAGAEELIGAKLVAPIVLKLHQKPNKLVSFPHHTNFTNVPLSKLSHDFEQRNPN